MKNKMRKMAGTLLTACMTLAMLTGCGSRETEDNSSSPESESGNTRASSEGGEESRNFTMLAGIGALDWTYYENPPFMLACENAGVSFDITHLTGTDIREQTSLLLSSGDYPEVFFKCWLEDEKGDKYGPEGIFIPLEGLIREHAPNLCAELDANNLWSYITASDGHVYTLPELQGVGPTNVFAMINGEWLEKLNVPVPTDLESLYTALKAIREGDPNGNGLQDEIPLAADMDITTILNLLQYFDVNYNSYYAFNETDGVYFLPDTQLWYDFTEYVTRLYSEGLINQDAFTISLDSLKAKASAGDIILGMFWDFTPVAYTKGAASSWDEVVQCYDVLKPFSEGTYPTTSGVINGTFAITDKCTDPSAVMAWVDQFYGEEGAKLAYWGVEDVNWKYNDDGMIEEILQEDGTTMVTDRYKIMGVFNHPGSKPSTESLEKKVNGVRKWEVQLAEIARTAAAPWPVMSYTAEENSELSVLQTDIHDYLWSYFASVVTGEVELESTWEEYLVTLEEMGLQRLKEIQTTVYERGKLK